MVIVDSDGVGADLNNGAKKSFVFIFIGAGGYLVKFLEDFLLDSFSDSLDIIRCFGGNSGGGDSKRRLRKQTEEKQNDDDRSLAVE